MIGPSCGTFRAMGNKPGAISAPEFSFFSWAPSVEAVGSFQAFEYVLRYEPPVRDAAAPASLRQAEPFVSRPSRHAAHPLAISADCRYCGFRLIERKLTPRFMAFCATAVRVRPSFFAT